MTNNKFEIETVAVHGDRCAVTMKQGETTSTVLADKAKVADCLVAGTFRVPVVSGVDPDEADERVMDYLKACWPADRASIRHELVIQCSGVTVENGDDVARASIDRLLEAGKICYYEPSDRTLGFMPQY